jgi:hypothetical protein
MTKTLTEQWKDGELPVGSYYINLVGGIEKVDFFEGLEWERTKDFGIEEVLAPVPSYDEYCNLVFQANKPKKPLSDVMMCYDTEREKKVVEPLQKQLAIATKALKEYNNRLNWDIRGVSFMKYNKGFTIARKALKEMEGVK